MKQDSRDGGEPTVTGECSRCCRCCVCWKYDVPDQPADQPPRKDWCPHLDPEAKVCRIWENRPEGCRLFPTTGDFELGCVPECCGFRLVKGDIRNG